MKIVAALYDNFEAAQNAVRDLVDNGFDRNDISIAVNNEGGEYDSYLAETDVNVTDAAITGAGTGAVLGGLGGLAVGLGVLFIPGLGPILAAGPLFTTLVTTGVGVGVGALAGGLIGALVDLGIPAQEAEYYAEGVRRGGTLVTAKVAEEFVSRVKDILDRYDPADMEERVSEWQASGWSHFDPLPNSYPADNGYPPAASRNYNFFDADFRRHYLTNYINSGYSYEEYLPAYRYGYDLAHDPYYQDRDWFEVEPEAQRYWEETYDGPWEQFKEATRQGWEAVKAAVGIR